MLFMYLLRGTSVSLVLMLSISMTEPILKISITLAKTCTYYVFEENTNLAMFRDAPNRISYPGSGDLT